MKLQSVQRIEWEKIAVGAIRNEWQEKQFVGRWAGKRRDVWMEIPEAWLRENGETDILLRVRVGSSSEKEDRDQMNKTDKTE